MSICCDDIMANWQDNIFGKIIYHYHAKPNMNDSQHAIVRGQPMPYHWTMTNYRIYGKLDPLLGILDLCQPSVKRMALYHQHTRQSPPCITYAIIPHVSGPEPSCAKSIVFCYVYVVFSGNKKARHIQRANVTFPACYISFWYWWPKNPKWVL